MRYQIHRGGLARTVKGGEVRRKIDRELHGVVIAAQGDLTIAEVAEVAVRATNWWTDLRRGQNVVYGSLFRFLDVAIATGTPKEVLKTIPQMIDWYIEEECPPQHPAPALRLIA